MFRQRSGEDQSTKPGYYQHLRAAREAAVLADRASIEGDDSEAAKALKKMREAKSKADAEAIRKAKARFAPACVIGLNDCAICRTGRYAPR